ncbi:MAG TPA: alpha/beta hydrolase, partial [Lachnospiraceae bacterium]|nr:alpha/beta hydrolase [Lachnospiraceae bacterium]
VSPPFSDWLFQMGLQAASYATIAISKDWITEELFNDLPKIHVPTLIMHGIHDQVVPYQLGVVLNKGIRNSKLITFENSGHGLFYDEMDKFNRELTQFVG